MNRSYYTDLTDKAINSQTIEKSLALDILQSKDIELLSLIHAAYDVRKKYCGKTVTIHIINNAQNGFCPEDCHYCAQAKTSDSKIEEYPIKSESEILAEAKNAYEKGAHRYCMVFGGRGPSMKRVEHLAQLIQKIKSQYPLEICVSAGLIDQMKAKVLKEAGLDRLNHNLNTSEKHYPEICTTHTYEDRLNTLKAARTEGISLCSGIIVGMNESLKDIIDVAYTLNEMQVASIPVNFFIPIEGNTIKKQTPLTPDFCLRVLSLFRFLNPKAEIRVAAGREYHLKDLEVLSLYPANSLFLDGYLNTKGSHTLKTLRMIKEAGFDIESSQDLNQLIDAASKINYPATEKNPSELSMKDLKDLRPTLS